MPVKVSYTMFLSGETVECPNEQFAFGRCSTSHRDDEVGDCDGNSHASLCCDSNSKTKTPTCGWIYASYGTKTECPNGLAVAGFCGVNNKGDCPNNNFLGIRCCQV